MTTDFGDDSIVEKKIGGKYLQMRASHKLPSYYDESPFYDRALPRISKKMSEIDGYLDFVDIGANIGDTVSLVTDKVDGTFLCVEGDGQFLPFLKNNTSRIKNSKVIIEENYCGEDSIQDDHLKVHRENGTARLISENVADGLDGVKLKSLDDMIKEHAYFKKTNLLKIDTDGFDFNVLKSGLKFLKETKPVIYFEFDPELCLMNNEEPLSVFDLLHENGYYEALVYDNFGIPIKVTDMSDKGEIQRLLGSIDKKKVYYYDILTFHHSKKARYRTLFESELISSISLFDTLMNSAKTELNSTKNLLHSTNTAFDFTKVQLASTVTELSITKTQLDSRINELNEIYYSRSWRFILYARKILNFLIPSEDARNKALSFLYRNSKKIVIGFIKVKGGISGLSSRYASYFTSPKPRKGGMINIKSKKIVFIDHSFHSKTKSSEFILDYLKSVYDVKVILDDSWLGKPFPDMSFIDESFLCVIFWQLLPNCELLQNIKNDNIILFPMFDQSRIGGFEYWDKYQGIKIINFSKALHTMLKGWGHTSMYIQYFPAPREFTPGKNDEVFFWQRLSDINVGTITRLFGQSSLKIHVHRTVDPGQRFIQPSPELEERFGITYSDWFKTRDEMLDVIKQKGIYVASREYEGIGMSFLEAMAMGKAVVAVDNPTMNEYIEDGKTGYLFDLSGSKAIDFSCVLQVQKNSYDFICAGFKKWEKDRLKIIDFIKQ